MMLFKKKNLFFKIIFNLKMNDYFKIIKNFIKYFLNKSVKEKSI